MGGGLRITELVGPIAWFQYMPYLSSANISFLLRGAFLSWLFPFPAWIYILFIDGCSLFQIHLSFKGRSILRLYSFPVCCSDDTLGRYTLLLGYSGTTIEVLQIFNQRRNNMLKNSSQRFVILQFRVPRMWPKQTPLYYITIPCSTLQINKVETPVRGF